MSTHEPPPGDPATPDPASLADPEAGLRATRAAVTGRTWALVIVAAILAGAGSWLAVEGLLRAYAASFEPTHKPYPSADDMRRITRARIESGTLAFGATGGLLGLMLGLAGGASRRSTRSAALAAGLGLLVGGLAEAGAARLGLSIIYHKLDPEAEDLLQTLLGHEALWSFVGVAGGLALGLGLGGRGRWWRAALGGLAGAALATVAYEFLGALAFPTHGTHQPLAESPETRALAQFLVPLGAAIGSVLAARDPEGRPKGPRTP